MTIGRTDKNKIKIKTDSPKGTRAVNCACCAPPCECPDSPGSPFVPPIAGEFEIDGDWSATEDRSTYSDCGQAVSLLADGTTLSLIWQCSGQWNIYAFNPSEIYPCQYLFTAVFDLSPVGTFVLYGAMDPSCFGRQVTISEVL